MGVRYLWDTNTAIYFLHQQFPPFAEKFIDEILLVSDPAISVITEIELLCWKTNSKKDIKVLHDFIVNALIFELTKEVKLKTADIRKKYKVKLPDAVIAATALIHDRTLLSRNVSDFNKINGLNLINPHDQKEKHD